MNRIGFALLWVVAAGGALAGYHLTSHGVAAPASKATPVATAHRPQSHHMALTYSSILSSRWPSLKGYRRSRLVRLIATGDVIPARSVNYHMVLYNDFAYPFRRTYRYLHSGDLTLINLEAPLVQGCPVSVYGMTFCGDPRAVQGLQLAGVDVACTANNHMGNYGEAGILETWSHLRYAGISPCGLGTTVYKTVKGVRFAFLAYNCVGERFDYPLARTEIRQAKRRADVVVVSVHWGKEYVGVPTTEPGIADDDPQKVAHWIIDSGADLIIGNHPHHVQAIELYHGKLITYAHGNFAFDQMFSTQTRQGVVGTYYFYGKKLVAVHYRPVFIYNYSQPHWATPTQATAIMNEMRTATRELAIRRNPRSARLSRP